MKKLTTSCLGILASLSLNLLAEKGPQDTWYLDREITLPQLPGFRSPYGVAVDPSGNSYVVDRDNDTITVWDEDGSFIQRIGTRGSGQGQLNNPNDIAVTEDEIYVVEESNHRIQVFDKNGTFLRKWGQHGSNNGDFHHPYSIALKMDGNRVKEVFVADRYHHEVEVFDENGTFLRKIGEHGHQENQIYDATGVAIGPDEKVYISSLHHNKVKVFETNGTYVRSFNTTSNPYDLAFYGDEIAVSLHGNHRVQIFDKNGTSITTIGTGSNSDNPGEFNHPWGLSYAPNGNLHVVDIYNNRVQVFDSNHSFFESYGVYGEGRVNPYGLHITPQNTFLITDTDYHQVFEIDINGSFVRSIAAFGQSDGKVYHPRSAFLGHDNRIYVADSYNQRIQIFDRNGSFITKFGVGGSGNGEFNQPYSVLVTPNNEILVADLNNHRIQVFDTNGTFLRKFGTYGTLEGQIQHVHDIAISDQGNVMVADYNNRRIIHFTPEGEFLRHYTTNNNPMFVGNLPHGLTAISRDSRIEIYDENGDLIKGWHKAGGSSSAFDSYSDGTIVWLDINTDKILFYKPTYRTVRPPQSKEIPLPEVLRVEQPDNTNNLEITFRINDMDSPSVEARMIAFIDGGNDLSKVIIPKTFTDSITGKLDHNVSTNQNHTVSWNVGADWSVGFGELEVAILAKDDRDLINLHFLTLPANDSNSTELKINRSPITDNDMLNVWYWLLAKGETDFEFNPSMFSINKPVPQVSASSYLPTDEESLVLWLDANDSGSLTLNGDVVSQWDDKSGNERHAVLENGTPSLSPNIGVNGIPSISFRRENGDDLLNISGTGFFAKHMFFICRSPNESWNGYGGILAHQSGRSSNYLLQSGGTNFHSYQYPAFVSKNGNMLSQTNGFDMSPITNFMILEIVVNANSESDKTNYKVGRSDYSTTEFDVVEILAFEEELSPSTKEQILNYLSFKSGISIVGQTLVQGSSTTALGRAYLFDKMNLREASQGEITRAKNGAIEGTVNQFTPSFQVGPNERPHRVNEYGFDTGAWGYWVTPK
jgi:hypothetical protein